MHSLGIDASQYDESFLSKSIYKRLSVLGSKSIAEYTILLESNPTECQILSDSLHISYSEFFRNPLTFAALEQIILPHLIAKKNKSNQNEIRIWCAACAGGHEAYTLAIILEDLKKNEFNKFSYRIFATDQSEEQIKESKNGQFNQLTIRNVSFKRVNEWFRKKGDVYFIKPELKTNIEFSVFDLFNNELSCPPSSIFGDFDIIICANLFFYYKSKYQNQILNKLTHCLSPGAFLITGEAEREILLRHQYKEVFQNSAIFSANHYFGSI